MNRNYKLLQPLIPELPGIYKFIDDKGKIIYVGKAKSLLKRTTSYFTDSKIIALRPRDDGQDAARLEYMVVETEHDVLLLESTLIKKINPDTMSISRMENLLSV